MTPADMSIIEDPKFREYAELYARDDAKFAADFANAYSKLLGLGVSSGGGGGFFAKLFGK